MGLGGALAGGTAATLGGSYLQNRANNKATKQQNKLIEQQAQQNNVMAMMYLQEQARLTGQYNTTDSQYAASANRAQKKVLSTLPMPKIGANVVGGAFGYNGTTGATGAPIGGRQMLLGA